MKIRLDGPDESNATILNNIFGYFAIQSLVDIFKSLKKQKYSNTPSLTSYKL